MTDVTDGSEAKPAAPVRLQPTATGESGEIVDASGGEVTDGSEAKLAVPSPLQPIATGEAGEVVAASGGGVTDGSEAKPGGPAPLQPTATREAGEVVGASGADATIATSSAASLSESVHEQPAHITSEVMARLRVPLPTPTHKAFHPWRAFKAIAKSIQIAVTPYSTVSAPSVKEADFPKSLPSDLHSVVEASIAHEDQRTARFDLKASAFLSTAGILIPLIATLMTVVPSMRLRGTLLASVLFAAFAGIAAFRALQLKVGLKLSLRVALSDDGLFHANAKHRHTLTLISVLRMEETTNDHRARLIGASSVLLATGTLVLCVAAIVLVA